MKLSIVFLATATSVLAAAAPLPAQVRIELAPRYGAFQPTGQAYRGRFSSSLYQNRMGQIAGLSLTTLLSPRWGFEVTSLREWGAMKSTAISGCKTELPTCGALPANTALTDNWSWLTGANVFISIPVQRAPVSVLFTLGGGAISRGGEAYDSIGTSNTLKFTGSYGVGMRVRVWDLGSFRADVQDYMSACRNPPFDPRGCSPPQHDLVLTTGFSVPLIGRR